MLIALVMEGRPRHILTLQDEQRTISSVENNLCWSMRVRTVVMDVICGIQLRQLNNFDVWSRRQRPGVSVTCNGA